MAVIERDYMRHPGPDHGAGNDREPPEMSGFLKVALCFIAVVVVGIVLTSGQRGTQPEAVGLTEHLASRKLDVQTLKAPVYPKATRNLVDVSPIDINTADFKDLRLLPRVRASIAEGIIAGRPYFCVEQLDDVYGIGPKTVELLQSHVVIQPESLQLHFPCEYYQYVLICREDEEAAPDREVHATQVRHTD